MENSAPLPFSHISAGGPQHTKQILILSTYLYHVTFTILAKQANPYFTNYLLQGVTHKKLKMKNSLRLQETVILEG